MSVCDHERVRTCVPWTGRRVSVTWISITGPPWDLFVTNLVLVWAHAEVLDGLTAVLGSTEDQGVASGRSTESELIQGDGLTTGSGNSGTSGGGESQSGDGGLGERQKSVVIGDGADNDDGALLALLVDV